MSSESTRDVVLVGGGHSHIQVLEHFTRNRLPNAGLTLVVDRRIAMYSGMIVIRSGDGETVIRVEERLHALAGAARHAYVAARE